MPTIHKITTVPYLQGWDFAKRILSIRVLVTPTGNPLKSLVPGAPAFAEAGFAFAAKISDSVDALPQRVLVDQDATLPDPGAAQPKLFSPDAVSIFEAMGTALGIPDSPAADTFAPQSRDMSRQVRKYLPRSYRQSFDFVRPRTSLGVVDDSYHCLMNCPPEPAPPEAPRVIGWGEAVAYALRRPRLAEAMGLIHTLEIPLDAAPRLEGGGWLWIELAASSDYAAEVSASPDFLRSFATRVPALDPAASRALFTPVVFPVSEDAGAAASLGNFDKVFVEALRFDDGFSKVVHARQPVSSSPIDEDDSGAPIGRDAGIQLGWDDEDILEFQNRALGAPPDGEDPVLAPQGVLGYRVDVRPEGTAPWHSLSQVTAPLNVGVDLGSAVEERWSEVVPVEHGDQIWLPAWFLSWRGGSLVVSTAEEQRLMDVPVTAADVDVPLGADAVDLRYGSRYEFRVRLADTTGGGPDLEEEPARPGESPVTSLHMKRYRRPSVLALEPYAPAADGSVEKLTFLRPKLGYPEALYASGPGARAELLNQIAINDAGTAADAVAPGVPDPDTAYLGIRVLVRAPAFDPAADREGFVLWYETSRAFPADPAAKYELDLEWAHAADYSDLDVAPQQGAEGTVNGPLLLTRARDVRVEVRALGRNDLSYFAHDKARQGLSSNLDFHAFAEVADEADALALLPPADALRSVFLRPDPIGSRAELRAVAVQNRPTPALLPRLAGVIDLVASNSMLTGRPGERVAFGCSGLAHYLAPDSSSLELVEPGELGNQWTHVLQAVLDRDWTWRGGGSPSLVVERTLRLAGAPGAAPVTTKLGSIELMHAINLQAAEDPDRRQTRLVFLDAMTPPLGSDGLPYEVEIEYSITLSLENGGSVVRKVSSVLPIVTRPAQVPRVVAAGVALTPYGHDADYASTDSRIKRLWVEFAEPLADPRDAYFARPLVRTPDPMLLPGVEPLADPEVIEGVPLDPELVRVVTPGQVQDLAGLSSMQRLEPAADSDRRFLLPLPPNTDPNSPALFSFFTYDLRVGHDQGPAEDPLWSTAQGRYGESLQLEGVQHPAPELVCSVFPDGAGGMLVRAPYATPYVGLRKALPNPPNTQIWILLYARILQADGEVYRNIQIGLRPAPLLRAKGKGSVPLVSEGQASWSGAEVQSALAAAGLPEDTPVTVLAVELLPEPNGSFQDPLGGDLGQVRILRTSPLAPIERNCCVG